MGVRTALNTLMKFFLNNSLVGLKRSPLSAIRQAPKKGLIVVFFLLVAYVAIAAGIGFGTGLFTLQILDVKSALIMALILFVFPSFLEEAFFRGVLIPNDALDQGLFASIKYTVVSTLAFVIWHPLNALTINPSANPLFLDGWFLVIVTALGVVCSVGYMVTRSLWVPILIHWLTVLVWVVCLGGRNLMLEGV